MRKLLCRLIGHTTDPAFGQRQHPMWVCNRCKTDLRKQKR